MAGTRAKYSIVGELGKGAFGVVYLLQGKNGHKLAVKTVDMSKLPGEYRARATDEAKVLGSLSHKHLVRHVNSYIKHPYLCIITEFCGGGDMDKVIDHLGFTTGLPENLIACWLMQTASALNYMHTHSPVLLHRDLKPSNIYVTETGDLRLGDLGLVRKLQGPADFAQTQVGTVLYLSPEILSNKPYNSKSDIWSLGCVFYDITGKKSNDEMGVMFLLVQVMGGRKLPLPDSYSEGLRKIITAMLTKDPSHRPSAANILASPPVRSYQAQPQKPVDIVNEFSRRLGMQPPRFARSLSNLKKAYSAPLQTEDILVPADAEKMLADLENGLTLTSDPMPANPTHRLPFPRPDAALAAPGMSSNSMVLFGGEKQGVLGAVGGTDGADWATEGSKSMAQLKLEDETFYDSETQPELGEEHLLLQIQQCQSECTQGLGAEILEAAYGIIANVHDASVLKTRLKELLGSTLYNNYGAKILRLRALEYGLHKTMLNCQK